MITHLYVVAKQYFLHNQYKRIDDLSELSNYYRPVYSTLVNFSNIVDPDQRALTWVSLFEKLP